MKEKLLRYLHIAARVGLILSPLICFYRFAPETVADIAVMCVQLTVFFGVWIFTLIRVRWLAGLGLGFWIYMSAMYICLIAALFTADYSAVGTVLASLSVVPTLPFIMLIGLGEKLLSVYSAVPILVPVGICALFCVGFAIRSFRRP